LPVGFQVIASPPFAGGVADTVVAVAPPADDDLVEIAE